MPCRMAGRAKSGSRSRYRADVDGEHLEFEASKIYVVNSGMMGTGLKITHTYAVDDGLLDCFAIDARSLDSITAAAARFLAVPALNEMKYLRQARAVTARGRAGPAGVDGRRVHRADAGQRRGPPVGPDRCRPLRRRSGSTRSTGRSTSCTRRSGSPTSGCSGMPGSPRSRPGSGWAARRPTSATYDALLADGITAVLDVRAERIADLAFYERARHRPPAAPRAGHRRPRARKS